jgi:hypothetical protein
MAFRSDDQDFRWRRPAGHDARPERARSNTGDSLSLHDTLRELGVTIAGFVIVIALITAAVSAIG